MKRLRDQLREDFYRWEKLGRGETVWDIEVLPEPWFAPYQGHGSLTEPSDEIDDGYQRGIVDRILGRRRPAPSSSAITPALPPETGDPPGYLVDWNDELVEIRLTPSGAASWPPKDFDPFLYSVANQSPVAFEYLANRSEISLQLAVSEATSKEVMAVLSDELVGTVAEAHSPRMKEWVFNPTPESFWMQDLALHREFMFPIPTAREFDRDPHVALLSVLEGLEATERVVVQIRFEPCVNRWADSIWRLITFEDGKPFFANGKEYLDAARDKLKSPLFAATIRLAIIDASDERCEAIRSRLLAALGKYEGSNAFVFADDYDQAPEEDLFHLIQRKSRRSGMLLNGDELLALVHLPVAPAGGKKLQRIYKRSHPAPEELHGQCALRLGTNIHQGHESHVGLSQPQRTRHMHVLGASGTGKSTFLLNSILQDLENGNGLALLDPHGDLVDAVLKRLPENRIEDVVLFDPSDSDYPVGFNILQAHSDIERNLLASDFVAIFERLSSSWGDQMTAVLGNAAMAFLESDEGGTLLELKRFLIEKGFRDRFLETVRDPEIRYFWQREFPLLRGTTQASLLTRLNGFLRHKLVRNMVRQKGERFNVASLMDEGKIILAPLSQGLIGQENSWLLGSLLVSRFYQAALSRQSIVESERRPFFLYLDEAHNFVTPSIASILSGSRKYGLGLILAHQSMDQFPTRESGILDSILTNCNTRMCFRLGDRDAPKIEASFDHFTSDDFRRLRTGEAICRVGSSDVDFNLSTSLAKPVGEHAESVQQRAIDYSRKHFATPRELLEAEPPIAQSSPSEPEPRRPTKRTRATPAVKHQENVLETPQDQALAVLPKGPIEESSLDTSIESKPESPLPKRTPGRGGTRHKAIQNMIKQHANGLGLRATIEGALPGNTGSVDVLLEADNLVIAIEVALRSPIEQEVQNIRKTIGTQVQEVLVVGDEQSHLHKIREAAIEELGEDALRNVRFLTVSELGDFFARLGAQRASTKTTSRGYKVTTKFIPPDEDIRANREAEVHRAVANRRSSDQELEDQ